MALRRNLLSTPPFPPPYTRTSVLRRNRPCLFLAPSLITLIPTANVGRVKTLHLIPPSISVPGDCRIKPPALSLLILHLAIAPQELFLKKVSLSPRKPFDNMFSFSTLPLERTPSIGKTGVLSGTFFLRFRGSHFSRTSSVLLIVKFCSMNKINCPSFMRHSTFFFLSPP